MAHLYHFTNDCVRTAALRLAEKVAPSRCGRYVLTLLLCVLTAATAWADDVTVTDQTTTWASGNTYHVTSNVTIGSRISVTGSVTDNVTLIIADGVTLTASQGISSIFHTLTIEGTGTLIATGPDGIRGADGNKAGKGNRGTDGISGDVIINGATVHATGGNGGDGGNASGNSGGAGGAGGAGISGTVTFYGGTVNATGGAGGTGGSGSYVNGPNGATGKGIGGKVTCNNGTFARESDDNNTWNNLTTDSSSKRYVRLMTDPMSLFFSIVSGIEPRYLYTGSAISITPVVTDADGTPLTLGTHFTARLGNNNVNSFPFTVTEVGDYTLKIEGKAPYSGSKTIPFTIYNDIDMTSSITTWVGGFKYHVTSNMSIDNRISMTGDVTLFIADGVTLTASQGISIDDGYTLTIEGPGTLIATGKNGEKGLNGSGSIFSPGIETASGSDGENGQAGAPGISGNIIVNGAIVNATGGNGGNGGRGGTNLNGNYSGYGGAGGAGGAGISGNVNVDGGTINTAGGIGGEGGYGRDGNASNGATGKGIGGTVTSSTGEASVFESDDNDRWNILTTGSIEKRYVMVNSLSVLTLTDGDDNTSSIRDDDTQTCNVILSGRTLWKDGDWNTLCLPFNVVLDDSPLAGDGVTAMTLDAGNSGVSGSTLTLNFTEATTIPAGMPFIIKWKKSVDFFINTDADWETFAQRVNAGETFAGKRVLLNADINVSTMVGTNTHPFCGTFDGNGHTLNLSINDENADYAAPFQYISGATICNVKTTGSVTGINHCAGIVGAAKGGTNIIRNCWMDARVEEMIGNLTIGGILGYSNASNTKISNCYLTGSLFGTNIGIFYGGGNNGTHMIENCWANGYYSASGSLNLLLSESGTVHITNCRKNRLDETISQGEYYSSSTSPSKVADFLGSQWTVVNNNLTLKPSNQIPADIVNPLFTDVTIDNSAEAIAHKTVTSADGTVSFTGSYAKQTWDTEDKSILFLGAGSTLYYPQPSGGQYPSLNAFRAYFKLADGTQAREFKLNFGGDGVATSIESVQCSMFIVPCEGAWYTLDGRKLDKQPTKAGLYIHNGRKVVIK